MADPASIGVKVALTAASMAFQMSQKITGPRLDNLKITGAEYGTPWFRVYGGRRLDGLPIIHSEKLREKKVTSKTKGGKYSQYKYYWTGGVGICDHEIDAVQRIWMDRRLVYDVSAVGPISVLGSIFSGLSNRAVKLVQGRNMRLYMGTETQEVDPRYEEFCEDRYGAGSTPAMLGRAWAMFEELPVEKFGNRVPQISMQVVRTKQAANLSEQRTTGRSSNAGFISSYSGDILAYFDGTVEWWDAANRVKMGTSGSLYGFGGIGNMAMDDAGNLWYIGQEIVGVDIGSALIKIPVMGVPTVVMDLGLASITLNQYSKHFWHGGLYCGENSGGYWFTGSHVPSPDSYRNFFNHENGDLWAITQPTGSSNQFSLVPVAGGEGFTVTGLVTRSGVSDATALHVAEYHHFFVVTDGKWYTIDDETGAVLDSGTAGWDVDPNPIYSPDAIRWFGKVNEEYSLKDGSLIRTVTLGGGFDTHRWVYEPVTHAIIRRPQFQGFLIWSYIDRLASADMTLGDVIEAECALAGLDEVDVTGLTQPIAGYSLVHGPAADGISPLLDIHDVDACPHDFGVKFKVRGGAADGTIDASEFVADGDKRWAAPIVDDITLPQRIVFTYADGDKDQQKNTATFQRSTGAVDSQRQQSIDLTTYVSTPVIAQPLVDRYGRRKWFEREMGEATLTMRHAAIEPGDVKSIVLDGEARTVRVTDVTRSGVSVKVKWVRDDPRVHDPNAAVGPTMDGRDEDVILVAGLVKGHILDTPLLTDSDAGLNPSLYYGAGTLGGGAFLGATAYEADLDGDEYIEWNGIESADQTVWGFCTNALGNANPNLWDRGNVLNVKLFGELTSCTEADIDANPRLNQAIVGSQGNWEIVNFTTAAQQVNGTWNISGFKRGRRGTEGEVAGHLAGDHFILAAELAHDAVALSEVGTELDFKVQGPGRSVDAAEVIEVDFTGASLKPYAPAWVKWYFDGTDMQGTIRRRTRVGGAWVGGATIPLSEASQEYEVEVYSGATLKRTITLSGTNTFTYTNAQMVTDFGTALTSPPTFRAYQLSDAVGRGFALAA